MPLSPHLQQLKESIQSRPHWFVRLAPATYRTRIQLTRELSDLYGETRVSLRGWDFPHLSEQSKEYILADGRLISWCDWSHFKELWSMYASGQFAGVFALRELDPELQKHLRRQALGNLEDVPLVISLVSAIYTVTEVFEFASRMTRRLELEEGVTLSLRLHGCQGSVLVHDALGSLPSEVNPDTVIELGDSYSYVTLRSRHRHAALEETRALLSHFGVSLRDDVLRQHQENLYRGGVGQDGHEEDYDWESSS
jgi:hypothetical protein